ncbi:M3 family metallopeptidase [Thalassotalea ganghwensis]
MRKKTFSLTLVATLLTTTAFANDKSPAIITSGINVNLTAQQITSTCEKVLDSAHQQFTTLEQQTGPATLERVVGEYEAIMDGLAPISHVWYFKAVHPSDDIRDASTQCSEKASEFYTRVGLSKDYYQRLAAIDLNRLNAVEKHMINESLTNYQRAGVDRSEAVRKQITDLQKEITSIGNEFSKNIREDVRYVDATIEQLAGLPEDYIAARPADENGIIKISTDYPDLYPVMTYGESDDLRKKLRIASRARGYPQNAEVLNKLIAKRDELAKLLGYENHAALSMAPKMIANPDNAEKFLARIGGALEQPVEKELDVLLKRLQKIDPSAQQVQVWQASYLMNLIRQEDYAVDSKEVRQYFNYDNVRDGIFGLTEDLFGVTIRPWKTETWHEDVESFEMLEDGKLIGRFYMDNHPRKNKYKHAAHWTIRTGLKDKQIPVSALAQNFPNGLMEHSQVETFLHEFGHLLHNMFSGNQKWYGVAGMSMERDFVEAPSQMLEEWIWDYNTLKNFARNEKGEVIPKSLVEKMNKARDFGQATATATQVYYANLALSYYSQDPDKLDLEKTMVALENQYAPYPFVEGTHFYANFGHLYGYSSDYYTYQWSLAIATDLFSRFDKEGMRNKAVAKEYREKVLGAAGSKPAAEFVADFLKRDFTPDTYINKLKSL